MNTDEENGEYHDTSTLILFTKIAVRQYKRKYPEDEIELNNFAKKCAEHWKMMEPEERKRFKELAEMDETRCDQQHGGDTKEGRIVERSYVGRRVTPLQPRCPLEFFMQDYRCVVKEINPNWTYSETTSELRRNWKVWEDKRMYKKLAQMDRQRYAEEMKAYIEGRWHFSMSEAASKPGSNSDFAESCETPIPCCSTVTTTTTGVVGDDGPFCVCGKCMISTKLGWIPLEEESEKRDGVVTTSTGTVTTTAAVSVGGDDGCGVVSDDRPVCVCGKCMISTKLGWIPLEEESEKRDEVVTTSTGTVTTTAAVSVGGDDGCGVVSDDGPVCVCDKCMTSTKLGWIPLEESKKHDGVVTTSTTTTTKQKLPFLVEFLI
uniref:HMG box domain-containing protein n=1 Tax=Trichobilharzia regenti TaxID=157069 RepID=A0AA85J758_TRIRE|nr:unnamed protein product [Trichobilharzia regenti]